MKLLGSPLIASPLPRFILCAGLLGLTVGQTACDGDDVAPTQSTGTLDVDAVVASAQAYADEGFTKVNAAPIPGSQHSNQQVNVWVSNDALETYLSIEPGGDSAAAFAPGTILVKEQLTDGGDLSGLTVMAKGSEGYDDDTDDWWWGRIETSGEVTFSGNVGFCVGCHTPAKEATDWVFGVHLEDRAE